MINPTELKGLDYKNSKFTGTVVSTNDPLFLKRIKVSCPILYGDVNDPSYLPWCRPEETVGLGGSSNTDFFYIPNVGSKVSFYLEGGDQHHPVYTSRVTDALIPAHTIFQVNYPFRYGWVDEQGTYFVVDRMAKTLEMYHMTGTYTLIDSKGNITVSSIATVTIDAATDIDAVAGGNINATASGNITAKSTGSATVTAGSSVTVTAGSSVTVNANGGAVTINSSGDTDINASGNANIKANSANITASSTITLTAPAINMNP